MSERTPIGVRMEPITAGIPTAKPIRMTVEPGDPTPKPPSFKERLLNEFIVQVLVQAARSAAGKAMDYLLSFRSRLNAPKTNGEHPT